MKPGIFTAQEMYLTGFDYIVRNTCISDEDLIKASQIRNLLCEDIRAHSHTFLYSLQN